MLTEKELRGVFVAGRTSSAEHSGSLRCGFTLIVSVCVYVSVCVCECVSLFVCEYTFLSISGYTCVCVYQRDRVHRLATHLVVLASARVCESFWKPIVDRGPAVFRGVGSEEAQLASEGQEMRTRSQRWLLLLDAGLKGTSRNQHQSPRCS